MVQAVPTNKHGELLQNTACIVLVVPAARSV